jgi:multiple sugar transport system ATP-binding protein
MGRIELDDVTKRFGPETAVEDLNLDIEDEEFLVLVGPSGCGKSTTLRMIAGLETPTEGDVYIDGDHMNYRVPQNRDIAMVFQDYALYPHMTVRGNIGFGLEEEEGYTKAERGERVEEVAEMLGISELLDRKPDELSGGQQQRVALGRAIVRSPEAFLMDEPLANLDAKLRSEMRAELQNLQEMLEVTTVYVTHNQTEAMTMGDRIAVLDDGRLQQVGEPLELYHEPANRFVAGFIGEPMMNFLEGELDGGTLVTPYLDYSLDDDLRSAVGDATALTLGIRPEDIELEEFGGDPGSLGDHEYVMNVTVVEPHGNQNVVHLNHAGAEDEFDVLQAVTGGMEMLTVDEEVVVSIDPDLIHLFDGQSGQALHNRRMEAETELTQI